jgi:hypothetical protein
MSKQTGSQWFTETYPKVSQAIKDDSMTTILRSTVEKAIGAAVRYNHASGILTTAIDAKDFSSIPSLTTEFIRAEAGLFVALQLVQSIENRIENDRQLAIAQDIAQAVHEQAMTAEIPTSLGVDNVRATAVLRNWRAWAITFAGYRTV